MSKKSKFIIDEIIVENFAAEGKCIARHEGEVIFIEGSNVAPGDKVKLFVSKRKKKFAEANVMEILEKSEMRIQPFCQHFGLCGGCKWQHIPYEKQLELKSFFCDLYFEGKQDMAWNVADFGFEMTLTSYIPKLVKSGIKSLIDRLLSNAEMTSQDIDLYAMHPGGKAILEAIESSLEMKPDDNRYAYQILRDYGNMSSCTVLFVLNEILKDNANNEAGKNILSCAFGPGLTLESMVLTVHG